MSVPAVGAQQPWRWVVAARHAVAQAVLQRERREAARVVHLLLRTHAMTDRPQTKQTPFAELPARAEIEPDREALAHSVRDHRRAVEETVEALKTKLTRASDRVEHARDRVEETTDYLRTHRWPALGAATVIGLMMGVRRRYRPPPVQLMLPSGMGEIIKQEKKKTLLQAAFAAIGTMILREVGMRAMAIVEEQLLRASNPPEPPVR